MGSPQELKARTETDKGLKKAKEAVVVLDSEQKTWANKAASLMEELWWNRVKRANL